MAEFALRELIDEKRLQHLQNEFCKVTGVTAVCVDKEGRAITEPYIDKSLGHHDLTDASAALIELQITDMPQLFTVSDIDHIFAF